jgi:hypothetical protein
MSNTKFEIDVKNLEEIINQLSGKEMAKAQKRALSRAGRLLFKQTKQNVASMVPNSRKPNPKYSDTLYDGVRIGVQQDSDFRWFVKVHVLGSRGKTSGTFRLRFFEGGTVPRKTKNAYTDKLGRTYPAGQNRGQLRAINFFSSAVSAKQSEVIDAIETNLLEEIQKIIND